MIHYIRASDSKKTLCGRDKTKVSATGGATCSRCAHAKRWVESRAVLTKVARVSEGKGDAKLRYVVRVKATDAAPNVVEDAPRVESDSWVVARAAVEILAKTYRRVDIEDRELGHAIEGFVDGEHWRRATS